MTELEILAELKRSYRYISDIIDNASITQIGDKESLQETLGVLEEKYEEVYEKAKKVYGKNLEFSEDFDISDNIYFDYMAKNGMYLSYLDMEKSFLWWEDYDFLTQ